MLDRYALSDQTVSFEITGIPQDLYTLSANEISVEQDKKLGSVLLTVNEDNRNTDDILGSILFTGVSDGLELGTTLSSDITILKSDYFTALDDKLEVVSIYPNPVKDYLKIEVEELILSSVEVFNIHGYLVFKRKLVNGILDISRLMNGVYFIKIVTNNQKIHLKRIVKY